IRMDGAFFCVWEFVKVDSKGGSWRQSGGLSQPPWLFRRKANPPSPTSSRNQQKRMISGLFLLIFASAAFSALCVTTQNEA
ncbi:MAG: hypothetical protein IKI69_00855, partial [Oscillospiraceae bacterium]|nr:hypothetical protein [Oscillospiraceae bacterium]